MNPGIYLVHKNVGETSFSIVRSAMAQMESGTGRRWPLCHGGTLDPFAEGLLLLLVGPATKLMDLIHGAPKTYVAQVRWGAETDNGDGTGRIVAEGDPSALTVDRLNEAIRPFIGWTEQVPPATSAKKVGGEPAYRKAHRGEEVVLPPSRVYLHEARWLSHDLPHRSELELVCRGGYYVRALARDLGRALGVRAHLTALRRTAIGPWRDPSPGAQQWLHGQELLPWWSARTLSDAEVGELRKTGGVALGKLEPPTSPFPPAFPDPQPLVRAFHLGKFIGLLRADSGRLVPVLQLRNGL